METIVTEQIPQAPEAAPGTDAVKDKADGTSYGKFKSKEGLLEAYNSLESEFTRRSQRIKELETQINNRSTDDKWTKKVDDLTAKYPVAKELTAEIGEFISQRKELLGDENCLEKALLAVLAARYEAPQKKEAEGAAENPGKPSASADRNLPLKQRAAAYMSQAEETAAVPELLPQGGELPAAPIVRPRTVREAGDLARKLLKNNNN